MKKKICLLLACVLLLLPGCGKQEASNAALTKVTLNEVAHSIFYAPQYVAIEQGYFAEEGIDLELVTGFGADKVATALISGEADIGFMGSESSIYIYNQNPDDYIVNFAQLTQRAGNFLVSRQPAEDFQWEDLKDAYVLGGRKGGMPQMVFEFILKKNNIDPAADLTIDQSIDFGSTAAAFTGGEADYTVVYEKNYTIYSCKAGRTKRFFKNIAFQNCICYNANRQREASSPYSSTTTKSPSVPAPGLFYSLFWNGRA